jgi:hypothetical protein
VSRRVILIALLWLVVGCTVGPTEPVVVRVLYPQTAAFDREFMPAVSEFNGQHPRTAAGRPSVVAWYETAGDVDRYRQYVADTNLARGAQLVVIDDEKDESQAKMAAQFSKQSRICFGDLCRLIGVNGLAQAEEREAAEKFLNHLQHQAKK